MIVCPQCRHVNEEEAQFCSQCGRSLEPGPSALAPLRREARVEEEDLPPPAPRKRWPVAVAVGALLLGGLVAWMVTALRPDPCDGRNFVSERFGYCMTVPEGWDSGAAMIGTLAADQVSLPGESTTVLIQAVDLPVGLSLDEYTAQVRDRLDRAGVVPGPIRDEIVDGVPARSWDSTLTSPTGEDLVARYVVTLRDEIAWEIALSDTERRLIFHDSAFRSMLASWRFR